MIVEYITLGAYLLILITVGALFSKLNRDVSDFARGGAQGTWWMVGTSMFMGGISAFTFTGNASAAFEAGPTFLVIYFANCIGLLLCFWIGPWFRQTRATTWADVIRERFDVSVEQFSAYISILIQPVGAATQLYALAIFGSTILNIPTVWLIIVLGAIVVFYSTTGGRWAVMATDFVQGTVLFALTLLVFYLALEKVGGVSAFFNHFNDPGVKDDFQFVKDAGQFEDNKFTIKWIFVVFFLQLQSYLNLGSAGRFLSVKDSQHARHAALWASVLMVIGTIVWFLPPMVARFLYEDQIMALGIKEPATASYAVIAQDLLPTGLMGLMFAAMLAATMSSMDTGLNSVTGIIVKNVIPPLRKRVGLAEMSQQTGLYFCRLVTLLLGITIIVVSVALAKQEELALFDIYLLISAVIGLPLGMPILLAMWIKRLHWWSFYIILVCALAPSAYFLYDTKVNGANWPIQDRLWWIYGFSALGCLLSLPLWRLASNAYKSQVEQFYKKMYTPIDYAAEIGESQDTIQYKILGITSIVMGSGILLFLLVPNTMSARLQIVALSGFVLLIGGLLLWQLRGKSK
ncbi:sodium:solute symporter family transporter [Puniceicoccus vermicola]|uniref:Na+:solute symporter n=1 Tax=Puniceicoccus vermicola TaxID=388746 RepID=A0A7X1AUP3_9BACT|nr:hypothetical protein [Puniceicoccus vermicola]MBC2600341.1 hypothetical protein [Puniceicoccus vermicola]